MTETLLLGSYFSSVMFVPDMVAVGAYRSYHLGIYGLLGARNDRL